MIVLAAWCISSAMTIKFDYFYVFNFLCVQGNPDGCYSSVGRQGRRQTLNLALYEPEQGCFRLGTIMHEFIHALGFYHMQSATERDDFVRIAWEHIQRGMEHNFNRYDAERITNFGVEYDVTSVMHYSAYAFTSNGYATIIPNVSWLTSKNLYELPLKKIIYFAGHFIS